MKPIAAKLLRLLAVAAVAALVLATVTPPTGIRAGPAASPVSAALGPTDPGEVEAFFDDLMPRQLESERVVGAAVAVVKDGRLLFAKGYGYADLERGRPVEAERTLFYPGSTGKLFTWTAVMQLAEQGKLDLHADVNRYLDFAIPATYPQPITLAHLLTHTAGFEEEMGLMLAGYVVERVSGQPFEAYIAEHILTPHGMERSAAVQPLPAHLADLAGTYVPARVAHTSPQKLVDWIKAVDVAVDGDNRLLLAGRPYAEIAPGLFVQVGGERRMAFGRDARGRVTHLFWGPIAYLKVPWYQAPMVQLGLLALCVAVLASALVAWPVHAWVARRRGDPPSPREARAARWLGALVGASSCALVGWYFSLMLGFGETYVFPTAQVTELARLMWLVPSATLGVLALAAVAWRRGFWNLLWRAHYTRGGGRGGSARRLARVLEPARALLMADRPRDVVRRDHGNAVR